MQLNPKARYDDANQLEELLADLAADLTLTNSERGENTSIRESLKELGDSASRRIKTTGPSPTPDPTVPSTSRRIPIDRQSLEEDDNIAFDAMHDAEDEPTVTVSDSELDSVSTNPWSDPVVRRTYVGLKPLRDGTAEGVD